MKPRYWLIGLTAPACTALSGQAVRADAPRPNIIHILADDLGWGSVGFNGQTQIATPNIDQLAAQGMRFENSYSAPVCAPSRAMLYTGFHQGHGSLDGNDEITAGFRAEDVMTPQVIAAAGYNSAIFGKWGFGATQGSASVAPVVNSTASLPNNHGFTDFYGYLNHGAAHDYFNKWMWQTSGAPQGVSTTINSGGPGGTAQYTHDLIAAKSEQYVAAHAADEAPFYMEVAYTIPHFDLDAISSAPGGYGVYASQSTWTPQQKAYAAMITRMDASIGSLMSRLDDPNNDGDDSDSIRENTLVIFTSDNGGSPTEDNAPIDFFNANGDFRGGKFELYEGGIHSPTVAYWPGTIAAGSVSDYRTDLADFMATATDLAGAEAPVGIDGTSIAPTLTGVGHQRERDYLVFEHQGSRGGDPDPRIGRWAVVRQDGMKLIQYYDETQAVFNLNADPSESSPLSLGNPANAQIAAELQAAAVAEGALRGVVEYRTYTGSNGSNVQDDSSWDGAGRPNGYWSATIANNGATPRIAHVSDDVTTLGVEIRGQSAEQVVDVHAGQTLTGRNEVRIGAHGRVDLSGGTLASNRWTNIRVGGELRGQGHVVGDVYNEGELSPGRADATAWPVVAPPALPPSSLNTGVVSGANFNFSGVQDDVPLQATSTLSPYAEVSHGLDFGPGVSPKLGNGGTDAGNEFNIIGQTGSTLAAAINNGDYISFTVDPVAGAGAIPSSVSFRVWRNGGAAAKNFAILSSIDGFAATTALAQATYTDSGSGNQHTLTATLPEITATSDPIEYRLYGWGATDGGGNTHINLASLNARFVGIPTLEFNLAQPNNGAPLTALKRSDSHLELAAGLARGPGLSTPNGGNAPNELGVTGFSSGASLQSAIDGGDYLSFAVRPIEGMAMFPDSVTFSLWRDSADSAATYAVLSSAAGFIPGQQLAEVNNFTSGSANRFEITGSFTGAQATTESVEFRLYGWNATASLASTHLVGASLRARFASIVGGEVDPSGQLSVDGDYYHLAGSMLAIDLGGRSAGVDFDVVNVSGAVDLEGSLEVSLVDAGGSLFSPTLGDTFEILTAAQGLSGSFSDVSLPALAAGLDWFVDYSPNGVSLDVVASADFNSDGSVGADDLLVWKSNFGNEHADRTDGDADHDGVVDGRDFLYWQRWVGVTGSATNESHMPIPEPAAALLACAGVTGFVCLRRIAGSALGS
ncbi:sulfatase-like hydrolase/transferase [Lacipirellula parvula]|uniref:Arylsulfatase n=1 Tax=Lacipirellula parvula TaxID=2650471 RepID=A0A5K7X9W2_9BACT|nr:sulfatase-like hydrolase/transferase [Lacipirellula parvula]BBO33328.1 arylsulfatase [Lacipirellula parvula]